MDAFGRNTRIARTVLYCFDHRLRPRNDDDARCEIGNRLHENVTGKGIGNLQRVSCADENVKSTATFRDQLVEFIGVSDFRL